MVYHQTRISIDHTLLTITVLVHLINTEFNSLVIKHSITPISKHYHSRILLSDILRCFGYHMYTTI
mgnify:CR=1 FL=1